MIRIISVTNVAGELLEREKLSRAFFVHRQLRPNLPEGSAYIDKMQRIFASGGRMLLAMAKDDVVGLGVYRVFEDTANGIKFYVDDLVTDESRRGRGIGRRLLAEFEDRARNAGASGITLDSGTQRTRAHRFYFREGFFITSFNFRKTYQ